MDEETFKMSAMGKDVLSVVVKDDEVSMVWLDKTWAEWKELQESPELKELMDVGNLKLRTAMEKGTKGGGKGKPAQ